MISPNDTITAVSSGTGFASKTIIRISGTGAFDVLRGITSSDTSIKKTCSIQRIIIEADDELQLEAVLYKFPSPRSYTSEDVAEIRICAGSGVVEWMIGKLFKSGARLAEPGEFTYRAYINGKMDLSQAEAVAEIVVSSNSYQLAAAENLLTGALSRKVSQIRADILDLLSLLEARLDFSGEDIEFVDRNEAIGRTGEITTKLGELLGGAVSFEEMIDAVDVGIAGIPNAGKSSLLNALLGFDRSIVSPQPSATRDVLRHTLKLDKCYCVLFDCAGVKLASISVLDELANFAAITALNSATLVLFCVDVTRENFEEELFVLNLINPKLIQFVATKSDLITARQLDAKIEELNKIFGTEFLPNSSKTGNGLAEVGQMIQQKIFVDSFSSTESGGYTGITQRHRQAVREALENMTSVTEELKKIDDEIAVMFLRTAAQSLLGVEVEDIDEKILDNIFANFCIGK